MKTIRKFNTSAFRMLIFLLVGVLLSCETAKSHTLETSDAPLNDQKIFLALLLDTSNSMDGLIDQAKSQLWKIVNELAAAKCADGKRPEIRIALFEYGNDGLSSAEGYIRLVNPFTTDLDLISAKLFSLTTNGGSEYCGQVIGKSLSQLEWSASESDLKMIFIAGNEPFTQGEVPYAAACGSARQKGIIVNTIYCGEFEEGIRTDWKRGAELANGSYMSIQQDRKTVYIKTPYDAEIEALNDRLNSTYVYYGREGARKKEMQRVQDENAASYGQSNKVERAVSKSSHAYKNSSWDLVDATKDDAKVLEETEKEYLPQEMRTMSLDERKVYITQKASERAAIQKNIQDLQKKRRDYIAAQSSTEDNTTMLDAAMINAVKQKAKMKNLSW